MLRMGIVGRVSRLHSQAINRLKWWSLVKNQSINDLTAYKCDSLSTHPQLYWVQLVWIAFCCGYQLGWTLGVFRDTISLPIDIWVGSFTLYVAVGLLVLSKAGAGT